MCCSQVGLYIPAESLSKKSCTWKSRLVVYLLPRCGPSSSHSISVHPKVLCCGCMLWLRVSCTPLYFDLFMTLTQLSRLAPDLEFEICWTDKDLHVKICPMVRGSPIVPRHCQLMSLLCGCTHQCRFFSFISAGSMVDSTLHMDFAPSHFILFGRCAAGNEDMTIWVRHGTRSLPRSIFMR